jgi:Xaa-Pro aminopeptidase
MPGQIDETVGEKFDSNLLQEARNKALEVILEASKAIVPGVTENQAQILIKEIQLRKGASKAWHAPQIRFGENTLLAFGEKGQENLSLKTNDIFFFDIGPIFDGHEGDVGRPFVVGNDPEMLKCCKDAEQIWKEVRDHWKNKNVSGPQLYLFAQKTAEKLGWVLTLNNANGHRISDFPHAAKARGTIAGFEKVPMPNRWILEIQIRHPKRPFGAFFEDLLA